jgi:ACR3 family arsenite transporter
MVVVWNDLADGNREYAAGLIALNSIFQVLLYSVYAYVLLRLPTLVIPVLMSISVLAKSRKRWYLFRNSLGIISRYALIHLKGEDWFQNKYVPFISPITLIALLFTIVIMFSLKGELIVHRWMWFESHSSRYLLYFDVCVEFHGGKYFGADYSKSTAIAFTATGNNFELHRSCHRRLASTADKLLLVL